VPIIVVFLVSGALLSGCYSSAGGGQHRDGSEDAAVGEDSSPDAPADAPDFSQDADADGSLDPLTDTQPWDAPDLALPEFDLPEIAEDAPAAETVGPPVILDDETQAGGPPSVTWNGSGWGVVWGDMMTPIVFRPLDPMADPVGPAVILDPSLNYFDARIEWHSGHYGVVGTRQSDSVYMVGLIIVDPAGAPLSGPTWVGEDSYEPDFSWSDQAGGWLLGWVLSGEGHDETILAALLDDEAQMVGEPKVVGRSLQGDGPRVLGLKSRNDFFWFRDEWIWHRGFRWPDVESGSEEQMVMFLPGDPSFIVGVAGFHDFSFVVGMDGWDVLVTVVEPWTGSIVSGPNVIGQSGIRDRTPGIAAVVDRGFLGVCYETGPGPWGGGWGGADGLDFRIIDTRGMPLGAPLVIDSEMENIGGCDVGWSGSDFLVIYWSCGGDSAFNRIIAQRVVPLF
jgi:hypothetical protein